MRIKPLSYVGLHLIFLSESQEFFHAVVVVVVVFRNNLLLVWKNFTCKQSPKSLSVSKAFSVTRIKSPNVYKSLSLSVSKVFSVTRIKLPNVYKSCPKMISLEK